MVGLCRLRIKITLAVVGISLFSYYSISNHSNPRDTAVIIVGQLRVGVHRTIAEKLNEFIVEPNNADVFACLDLSIYEQIPTNNTLFVDNNYQSWKEVYPTLRMYTSRPKIVKPQKIDNSTCWNDSNPKKANRWWDQFKGWECGLDILKEFEQKRGERYSRVIRIRPDIGFLNVTKFPPIDVSKNVILGQKFYHGNLMCDQFHFMTRSAADALFSVHVGTEYCNWTNSGAQCYGGNVNDRWDPPDWCEESMANETECLIDRWLRTKGVHVANDMEIPFGRIHVYGWNKGDNGGRELNRSYVNAFTDGPAVRWWCPWI